MNDTEFPVFDSAEVSNSKEYQQRIIIREVWNYNLEEEMEHIRALVEHYPYIAMDTEFPGVVTAGLSSRDSKDYQYQTIRANVDLMKLIQFGIALADENGNFCNDGCTCWQFNFKFDLGVDTFNQDSITLLQKSGINFDNIALYGIEINKFSELLMMSGLVLNENVKWITFHSSYDFGYLLKTLTCAPLPENEIEFLDGLKLYFPNIFDVKYMMTTKKLYGGLSAVAETLQVDRVGEMHQAGSDSLLTLEVFFALINKYFDGICDIRFKGILHGLGQS